MDIAPGEHELNLRRAIDFIRKAAAARAEVILLPEALPYGWTDPSAREFATEIPNGRDFQKLRAAAERNHIYVCSGLVERVKDRLFNAAVVIDPKGELLLHHRKINELSFAHELYSVGDRLGVCETPFGKLGMMICADGFIAGQVISRTLGEMGAQMILSPCAWAVPPGHNNAVTPYGKLWLDNYRPVCREFGLWIAGCSSVGPITSGAWKGHECIGNSLVINPLGEIACCGPHGVSAAELLIVDVAVEVSKRPEGLTPD